MNIPTSTRPPMGRAKRLWERVSTVPGLGRDVSALAVLLVLGVTAAALILSQLNFTLPWSEKEIVKAEFAQAVAISPGNGQEVRIAGVVVGQITDSTPTSRGTSVLTMELDPGHPVYDNAHLVLRPVNPLNQMYVTLNPGGPPGRQVGGDDVSPETQTERPVQGEEVFDHLDDRTRYALTSLLEQSDDALANAPDSLPGGLDATNDTLKQLQPVVTKLAQRKQNIQQLITAVGQISTALGGNDARLTSLVTSLQQTLDVLNTRDGDLARSLQKLPGTTSSIKNVLGSLGGLTDQLNPTLDDVKAASGDLPDALSSLDDAVGPLQTVIDKARPVVADGRPVVSSLRPVVGDAHDALDKLKPVSACLDDATSKIAPWMYDLGGFVYNTNSLFSVRDGNGGWGRGHATIDPNSPTGTQRPDENKTNTYQQGGSPLGQYPAVGSGSCH